MQYMKCVMANGGPRSQRGVVLVVALIFLLLITLLALSASGTSLLQEKLVGGLRNSQLADWSAESALRGAEWRLWLASSDPSTRMQCGTGTLNDCYVYNAATPNQTAVDFRAKTGWFTTGGTEYTPEGVDYTTKSADQSFGLAHNPYYLIEDLGREVPQGAGLQHESGSTGGTGTGYTSTNRHVYRITARGVGNNENAVRVLETTFAAKAD
jgi:type IV pilus assembly protein PilX